MGYAEIRMQREVQQLRREVKEAKAQDRQTRQGCLDLVLALREFAVNLEATDAPAAARVTGFVDQASALFDPAPDEE